MREKRELINFKAPIQLREAFDSICDARGITRTHGLNHLMHKFVIEMQKEVEQQNAELETIQTLAVKRKRLMTFKEFMRLQKQRELEKEDDLPVGFYDDGNDDEPF